MGAPPLTLALLFLGSLFMIFSLAYGDGAYKLIVVEWWAMAFAVIMGAQRLVTRARPGRQKPGLPSSPRCPTFMKRIVSVSVRARLQNGFALDELADV